MKVKHTLKSWRAAKMRANNFSDAQVSVVYMDSGYIVVPDDVANLIAAAPDLLAALKTLTTLMENEGRYPLNTDDARAAIAKANKK